MGISHVIIERLRFGKRVLTQDMAELAKNHFDQFKLLIDTLKGHQLEVKDKVILDIGCGRLYPYTLLLNSLGSKVIGIDISYIGYGDSFIKQLWKELRENSFESCLRTLFYKILLKDRAHRRALAQLCSFPLTTRGLTIKRMDAEDMAFPHEIFDIAISIAVFEHISDVRKAVSELHRVLKRGGIAYITIHLFTSLSGGHQFGWADPRRVPPWDHLRQRSRLVPVYLNRLREYEYLSLFRERLEILEVLDIGKGEGEDLLIPEIRSELADYSEEELLKRAITIIARKRDG